jgi:phenylacetate-CoA ligase
MAAGVLRLRGGSEMLWRPWNQIFLEESFTRKALGILPFYQRYHRMYDILRRSQWWSREQLEAYQMERLSALLDHAYRNVPYYRRVFDERGLVPSDINTLADLAKLPCLTKEIVRENLADLTARNFPQEKFEFVTTGGSTGVPLVFYYEKGVSRALEWAFMKSQWDRVGFRYTDKCVIMRGYIVNPVENGTFWRKTLLGRWLVMSSHHMTDEHLPDYITKIREFEPKYIQAYPSIAYILARFMKENDVEPFPSVRAVLCGSENLYPWQRPVIEEAFGCRVYSWYGLSEQVALAGECEVSEHYHIFPEYGIVELIGADGTPVAGEGATGEIVATGLHNYLCPLIRYKTNDIAAYAEARCACGRNYPLLAKVEGRVQDFVLTSRGKPISGITMNIDTEAFARGVAQFQFYQEVPGELVLKIVRNDHYTDEDTREIYHEVSRSCGDDITITLEFVDEIPRTERGKYRYLIQKIPVGIRPPEQMTSTGP